MGQLTTALNSAALTVKNNQLSIEIHLNFQREKN